MEAIGEVCMNAVERMRQFFLYRLGLSTQALSSTVWYRVLKERMVIRQCTEVSSYMALLLHDADEWQAVINLIVVSETWFFRESTAFGYLKEKVGSLYATDPVRPVRILSMPCSSGEEPYTIIMALNTADIKASAYSVEGIDISTDLLKQAREGIYGKRSFRGADIAYRKRYFTEVIKGEYRIHPQLISQVKWRRANIFDDGVFGEQDSYDIIFCRNLLIYLSPSAKKRLLALITRILAPKGILIVAPAEVEAFRTMGWQLVAAPAVGILQLTGPVLEAHKREKSTKCVLRQPFTEPPPLISSCELSQELQKVHKLADDGDFEEAERQCSVYLRRHVVDFEGYYLLGVIYHAQGRQSQAEECFQKAVYLSPLHYESLVYLTLLAEQKGDYAHSAILRQRIERSLAARQALSVVLD
jgi:chemotaxis protein methyltransferase WspC